MAKKEVVEIPKKTTFVDILLERGDPHPFVEDVDIDNQVIIVDKGGRKFATTFNPYEHIMPVDNNEINITYSVVGRYKGIINIPNKDGTETGFYILSDCELLSANSGNVGIPFTWCSFITRYSLKQLEKTKIGAEVFIDYNGKIDIGNDKTLHQFQVFVAL